MIKFNELNLDSVSEQWLRSFERECVALPLDDLAQIVGNDAPSVIKLLIQYSQFKRSAIANRQSGNVIDTQVYETMCDNVYRRLPNVIRW